MIINILWYFKFKNNLQLMFKIQKFKTINKIDLKLQNNY